MSGKSKVCNLNTLYQRKSRTHRSCEGPQDTILASVNIKDTPSRDTPHKSSRSRHSNKA